MRTRKKDKKNLVTVGIFITGLLCVLMIMIISIGKESSIFDPKVDIKARVANVSNLKEGSYVELKGIRIGAVTKIEIASEEEVEITMRILEKELKWIKEDSRVSISTAGLVGDKFVEIYKGSKDAKTLNPETQLLIADDGPDFKKMITKGESIASVAERILTKIDNILANMGDGKAIIEMINSLNKASHNLEKISSDLNKADMPHMVKSVNSSMMSFNRSSSSLERILARVEKGPGTINSLIYDESAHDDLRALLGGAQRNKVIKYFIRESIKKSEERKPQEQ